MTTSITRSLLLAALMGGQLVSAQPQVAVMEKAPFLAAALSQFISDTRTFTAKADLTVTGGPAGGAMRMPFGVAMDNGKMRFDLNLAEVKSEALNEGSLTAMKGLKLDRLMFVYYPGQPTRLVFPGLRAYVEMPLDGSLSKVQDKASDQASMIQKDFVGTEAASGVAARKYRLGIPGQQQSAFVWEAPAMNDLPVQLAVNSGGQNYQFAFRNVRQGPVDPRTFGIPANFRKYNSMNELMTQAVQVSGANALSSVLGGLGSAATP